jgi:hypothetical protein
MRLTLLAAAAALAACGNAGAQEWRTLDVSRQLRDTTALAANISYGAGTFTLGPATGADLYEMHLRYPAGRTSPVATYNPAGHSVHLGIKSQNFSMPGGDADQNELRIGLARGVPLDLTTEVAAADVKIDLGGLAVHSLMLKTGATDATLAFSSPNTIKMHSMSLNVGAAGFKATGLANANADHIRLRAGIGSWDLYFDGTWTGDIWLDAKIGLGSLTIHVPDDVRVDQNANAMLGAVSGDNGPSTVTIDTSDNDNADEADSSDDDNSSDDASVKAKAAAKATAKAAVTASVRSAMRKVQSAKVKKDGGVTIVQLNQTSTSTTPRFTLHIVGGATLGEIAVDHKLAGAGGQ